LLSRALRYQHEAMGNDHFDAVPESKRQVAHAALVSVLGSDGIASVTPVRGGATAAWIFRIEAGGRRYLLRHIDALPFSMLEMDRCFRPILISYAAEFAWHYRMIGGGGRNRTV
jgi:hypothetical protein